MANRRHRRIATLIALGTLIGWSWLIAEARSPVLLRFCSFDGWRSIDEASAFIRLNSPSAILLSYAAMIAAMMGPMLLDPVRHISDRTLVRIRPLAILVFCSGYGAVWVFTAPLLLLASIFLQLNFSAMTSAAVAIAAVLLWHLTPYRQALLNRCHERPSVSGRGRQSVRLRLIYGLRFGMACAAACAPFMLFLLLVGAWHLPAMIAASFFLWTERRLPPERIRSGSQNLRRAVARQTYWTQQAMRRSIVRLRLKERSLPRAVPVEVRSHG